MAQPTPVENICRERTYEMKFNQVLASMMFDWAPGNTGDPVNTKLSDQYWSDGERDYRIRTTAKKVYNVQFQDPTMVHKEIITSRLDRPTIKQHDDYIDIGAFIPYKVVESRRRTYTVYVEEPDYHIQAIRAENEKEKEWKHGPIRVIKASELHTL